MRYKLIQGSADVSISRGAISTNESIEAIYNPTLKITTIDLGEDTLIFDGNVRVVPTDIELIASGYEWSCPACGQYNRISGITDTVNCGACEEDFIVRSVSHTYD